jgi:hypothetical protein
LTFKDLQKIIGQQVVDNPEFHKPLARPKNKPFWIWDQQQHRQEDIRTKAYHTEYEQLQAYRDLNNNYNPVLLLWLGNPLIEACALSVASAF